MKIIKLIICFLIFLGITYLSLSFALWEFDVYYWDNQDRGALIVFSILLTITYQLLFKDQKDT